MLLRVDPEETEILIREPHAERFVMRGREMAGWLRIDSAGLQADADLTRWVALGVARTLALPAT